MKNKLTLLLLLWSSLSLVPAADGADFYWVGDGGSWSNPDNWASISDGDGTVSMELPGEDDNVFFDSNSFSLPNQVVIILGDRSCLNFSWTNISSSEMPTLFLSAGITLNIFGKIDLDKDMNVETDLDNPAQIKMQSTSPSIIYGVATNGNILPNLEFAGENGYWAITQDLAVSGSLTVSAGKVYAGADSQPGIRVITANQFIVDGPNVDLDISRMNITATSFFNVLELATLTITDKIGNTDFLSVVTSPLFQVTSSNATTFGTLNVTGTDGMINASGRNLNFLGDVTLEGSKTNTILGSHTFSANLILDQPGVMNRLEAGSSQAFSNKSNIIANGANCANYFFLRSTEEGVAANVSLTGGSGIAVERFYIQDVHATPDSRFSASLSVDLGNTDGWIFTPASSGTTFYWIGNTGDWSDNNNWVAEGGGSICIPTALDNVVFDEASFNGNNHTVTVDLPAIYFTNMTWDDPSGDKPTWSIPAGSINIGGSMVLAPSMKVSIGAPAGTTFNFVSDDLVNTQTITAADETDMGFDLANIVFDGSGSWSLGSELTASETITFIDGTFDTGTDSYNLNAAAVSINGSTTDISLNKSEIFTDIFEVSTVGTFNAGMSNIYTELFDITPPGMTFFEMILQGTEGILRGEDLIFQDVVLSNTEKSTVFGSHTYNRLLQFDKPGMIVEFEAGTTQQMANIESLGEDCGGEIFVRTTNSGSQVNFAALAGSITVDNLLLQDNAASPEMTFSATTSQDLGNNTNWSFTGAASTRYFYWRGGTGDWNTGSNWVYSNVFGEEPTNTDCIPTPGDDVYFDAASFTEAGQTITLNGPEQYCRNMTWAGDVVGVPTMDLPAGNKLNIYGGLQLPPKSTMTLNFGDGDNAVLWFKAKDTNPDMGNMGYPIVTSNHDIPNVTFEGPGGEWRLNGGIQVVDAITLINGHLNTNDFEVDGGQLLVDGAGVILSLGSSTLTIAELIQIDNIGTLNAGTSSLQTNVLSCIPDGLTFHEVQLVDIGDPTDINDTDDLDTELTGTNLTFNRLILSGSNNNLVHGSHTFNELLDLNFNPSLLNLTNIPIVSFIFDAGSTQSFAALSAINSNNTGLNPPLSRLRTNSDIGETATFTKAGNSVCLEFINIFDIDASGGATFGYNTNNAGITNSSGWTPTTNCVLLPVECTDFSAAVKVDNQVELYWTTAQEVNNSGFEVQRSTDGRRFETIAWVEGAGTTAEPQKYTYLDRRTDGLEEVYYRLFQIDYDGTSAYACDVQAVNLRNAGAGPLQVYPNPAGEQIRVQWYGKKTGNTLLRLFDQSGRLILSREWNTLEGTNLQELPITDLPPGIYELQLVDAVGEAQHTRIVKE